MALGSTQPLTERIISLGGWGWGVVKSSRCLELTTLPPSCVNCRRNPGSVDVLETQGRFQSCTGIAVPESDV
jgi:hypothetical protein